MAKRSRVRAVWTVAVIFLFTHACHQSIDPTDPSDPSDPGQFAEPPGPEPPPPPPPPAGVWFLEDFSSYGNGGGDATEDFRNDINDWYNKWTGGRPELAEIVLDPVLGPVYRQHQEVRTPGTCKPGSGAGRELTLPSPEKELWLEMYVRFSPTYKTTWWVECEYPEQESGGHKFIFWERLNSQEGSSWRFKVGSNGDQFRAKAGTQDYINSVSHGELPNPCFNDRWQRWRFHVRGASVQGMPDGHYEWRSVELENPDKIVVGTCADREEWNGPFQILGATPTDHHDGFYELEIGVTFNDGPAAEQFWDIGSIAIWRADPGWGW